ncbi:MAG: hypothetical protein GY943_19795 [Chloroflexi bacterium]|nr:hypothetical protein [Chloroflexota bacterium]
MNFKKNRAFIIIFSLGLFVVSVSCRPVASIPEVTVPSTTEQTPPLATDEEIVTRIHEVDSEPVATYTPVSITPEISPTLVETESQTVMETKTSIDDLSFQLLIQFRSPNEQSFSVGTISFDEGIPNTILTPESDFQLGQPSLSTVSDRIAIPELYTSGKYSITIVNLYDEVEEKIELPEPISMDLEGTTPGFAIFGWSFDDNWLAYAYIYPSTNQEVYLLNLDTFQSSLIPLENGSTWFSWSQNHSLFAITDMQTLYIGIPEDLAEFKEYQSQSKYMNQMFWHPFENRMLITGADNLAGEGVNTLWELDLVSEEWNLVEPIPKIRFAIYSPNGEQIAIYRQHSPQDLNELLVKNNSTNEVQIIDLPDGYFYDLYWFDENIIGLISHNELYIIPIHNPEESQWMLPLNDQSGIQISILSVIRD